MSPPLDPPPGPGGGGGGLSPGPVVAGSILLNINGYPKWMFPGEVFSGTYFSGENAYEPDDALSGVYGETGHAIPVTVTVERSCETYPTKEGNPTITITFSPAVARVAVFVSGGGFACHLVDGSCAGATFSGPIPAGTLDVTAGTPATVELWDAGLLVPANVRRVAYSAAAMDRDITEVVITPLSDAEVLAFANAADLPDPLYDYAVSAVPTYTVHFQTELYRADY